MRPRSDDAVQLATAFRVSGNHPSTHLSRTLRAVRTHLGMDVAFISEFEGSQRVFRLVDSALHESPIRPGESDPLELTYCQRVVDGRLPELIHDASRISEARCLPATMALPVGAHLSVPITFSNGEVYGTFCCFRRDPDNTLTQRDLAVMRTIADLVAEMIERDQKARRLRIEAEARIRTALSGDSLAILYQPIFHVPEGRFVGFESLARFNVPPKRSPDQWFGEAAMVGLGTELELRAAGIALRGIEQLPEDLYVSVNVSPQTVLDAEFSRVVSRWPLHRVVLEVTEHAVTTNYADIAKAVAPLRKQGMRLAVDDAGAGYASFRHILSLSPDMIKLDISLTQNIDTDASRRSLAIALIGFANATGSKIVAEGVEREQELTTLRVLGVNKVQGYFIGKPMPIEEAVRIATRASPSRE